ncbi:protein kinase subdomain-containing protein PKL/ccin9 [Coprinopsis cinerea okayama7|uniref:Protein kinase subdomain-containing protein PKL/ccin9 n=1 Tax=Coprinopsis cinerea (strain Okayama-7 / 130 / ATCC MYA-4618 / FGSC 9003) TaxID=240176 RepID=A8NRV1_COPC7|nr:protein kinase subdomain-containing protein PKL/ccin9 [Coprinopsis cinerea okayama7\|eukprot:XP_001835862.2 protein kinase subdomain-containing protein PKL/ccin9 [Coprinopsis cinerea okayama7\
MAEIISINCPLYGEGPDKAFSVKIQANDISILKEFITTRNRLSNVNPTHVRLFKVSLTPDELHKTIPNPESELNSPLAEISAIFNDLPENKVHVLAGKQRTGLKRSALESAFQFDALKRAKVVTESPSQLAQKSTYEEGWVHGDLPYCNILRSKDKQRVWVVDFDWGGRDGEVYYPTPRLNELLVEGRNFSDWKIRKEDDERILDLTFKRLGQV